MQSLNLYPTTSKAAGVQIDCHPAANTFELSDRNFFSCSVTVLVILFYVLSWWCPAMQLMTVVCTLWIWGVPKEKTQWCHVWWPRWPFHRTPSTNPTPRKNLIQQLADILSKVSTCSILLKENLHLQSRADHPNRVVILPQINVCRFQQWAYC